MKFITVFLLIFLVACSAQKQDDSIELPGSQQDGNLTSGETKQGLSYDLNLNHQEGGMRLNLLRMEEDSKKNEIRFVVVVEEIIGNRANTDPYFWFGNIYYGSGNIISLYQCKVERIAENKWHAEYCESFDRIPDEAYTDKAYFVFTQQLNSDIEDKFVRDVDKLDETLVIKFDLKDKFQEQRQK